MTEERWRTAVVLGVIEAFGQSDPLVVAALVDEVAPMLDRAPELGPAVEELCRRLVAARGG